MLALLQSSGAWPVFHNFMSIIAKGSKICSASSFNILVWQGHCHRPGLTLKPGAERDTKPAGHHRRSKVRWERGHRGRTSHAKAGRGKAKVATVGHRRAGTVSCTGMGTLYGCMLMPIFQPALGGGTKNPSDGI